VRPRARNRRRGERHAIQALQPILETKREQPVEQEKQQADEEARRAHAPQARAEVSEQTIRVYRKSWHGCGRPRAGATHRDSISLAQVANILIRRSPPPRNFVPKFSPVDRSSSRRIHDCNLPHIRILRCLDWMSTVARSAAIAGVIRREGEKVADSG